MNKPKILIIAASLRIGGAEKVARDIALYDTEGKYEYHYVVFGDKIEAYEPQLTGLGCRIFHLAPPGRNYLAFWRALRDLMRAHHYHAVHAHNMFNCGISMLAAKVSGVPVRISHAHSALAESGGLVTGIYEGLMRLLILGCSTDLVACGIRAGVRLYGDRAFRRRGELILNGIDIAAYRFDPEARAELRKELGLENAFLIGHTGHLMAVKNQRFLIERMPGILRRRPDARLLLLGDGPDRSILELRIRELNLQDTVLLPGNRTDIRRWLSAMDVFVFPSLYEGMPLSVIEAQASGLTCVISDGVPPDVHLTSLIRVLPLDAPEADWIDAICSAGRESLSPDDMAAVSRFDASASMERIHHLYDKKDTHD